MKKYNQRINSIDWIKAVASFSVTAVHFRNRVETNIPETMIKNSTKLFFSINYSLFIVAVPLFLLITGYLSTFVKPNKKRYVNLLKIYGLYIFIALISFQLMVKFGVRKPQTLFNMIYKSMRFELISGWYIELFFGLYLLAPYFNIILDSLSKKETKEFIILLFCVISIPSFINKFPASSSRIWLPNFYLKMYPFVYYVIGGYIKRYIKTEKIKMKKQVVIYLLSLLFVILTLYRYSNPYTKTFEGYYQSIINVSLSTSLFLIIYQKFSNCPNTIITVISKYTLSTYIVSLPVDRILYPFLADYFGGYQELLRFSPLIVIIAFLLALFSGIILSESYEYISKNLVRGFKKFIK